MRENPGDKYCGWESSFHSYTNVDDPKIDPDCSQDGGQHLGCSYSVGSGSSLNLLSSGNDYYCHQEIKGGLLKKFPAKRSFQLTRVTD